MQIRTFSLIRAAAAAASLLWGANLAQAQYTNMDDVQRRLTELEQQMATMQRPGQSRLASMHYDDAPEAKPEADGSGCDSCNSCDNGCCIEQCRPRSYIGQDFLNTGCRNCGVVFGAELLFLKPVASNGSVPGQSFNITPTIGIPLSIQVTSSNPFNFETSPRFWLGYVGQTGLGFRVQYWEFDHSVAGNLIQDVNLLQTTGSMRFRTFDWEATQQVNFARWRMLFFGGFRYAETAQSETINLVTPIPLLNANANIQQSFHGIGLTGGTNLYRSLFNSDSFGWFTNLRGSLVYGDRDYNYSVGALGINNLADASFKHSGDALGIMEIATGPQWQKQLNRGGYFFVRGGFETQLWLNAGTIYDNPFSSALGTLGLGGFSVATGIVR